MQPQRILVLTQKEQLEKLNGCTQYGWNAPVIMILFYDKSVSYKRDKYDEKEFGDIDVRDTKSTTSNNLDWFFQS